MGIRSIDLSIGRRVESLHAVLNLCDFLFKKGKFLAETLGTELVGIVGSALYLATWRFHDEEFVGCFRSSGGYGIFLPGSQTAARRLAASKPET